jgi:hypothetical protein
MTLIDPPVYFKTRIDVDVAPRSDASPGFQENPPSEFCNAATYTAALASSSVVGN